MRITRSMAAGALALALVAGACGSDDDGGDEGAGGTSGTTAPAVELSPAKDFTLPEPVKIVALIGDPSNSQDPNAVPDFNNGIRLAVEQINAAGGIGGHPVEFEAIDTSPTNVDQATNSLNLALQANPDVLIGPISSTTALGIAPRIGDSGIPTVVSTVEPRLARSEQGNPWLWINRPDNLDAAAAAAAFAVEQLEAPELGVLATNTAFGQQGVEGIKAGAQEAGGQVAVERTFEFNATDLTEPVTAMADTNAILDWGTPNTVALSITTLAQQGIDVPYIGPGSVGFPSFVEAVGDNSLLEGKYGAVDCNPSDDQRPQTQAFVAAYEEAYGEQASYAAAQQYDTVMMIRSVIEAAESAEPAAIQAGLDGIDFSEGTCAQRYFNEDGFLMHQTVITQFDGDGVLRDVELVEDI